MNTKKNALVFDGTTGNVVSLDCRTALDKVKSVDTEAFNRLLKLHENVKFHNSALYEIAWNMKEINRNQDFLYYGYKSTADMMESIYGYGKHSVSRMIAVSTYYTEEKNGKHVSFLYDSETENDMPLSNLTELLEKSEVMNYRAEELKQFYTELFKIGIIDFSTKQKDIRELRKIVSSIITRSLPLNIDSYNKVVEEKFKAIETTPTAQTAPTTPTAQTAPTAPTAPSETAPAETDTLNEFKSHMFAIMDIMENEKDENKKSEMVKLMSEVYKQFAPTKKTK